MTEHTPTPWTWHAKSIDQAHNGSIFHMKMPGHAYAIAMQPRYVDDKQFAADADFVVQAVNSYDDIQELLADLWLHFSATDNPILKKMMDRARALIPTPVSRSGSE